MILVAVPDILIPLFLPISGSAVIQFRLRIRQSSQAIKPRPDPSFFGSIVRLDDIFRRSFKALYKDISSFGSLWSSNRFQCVVAYLLRCGVASGKCGRSMEAERFRLCIPIGRALKEIIVGDSAGEHVNWPDGRTDLDMMGKGPDVIKNLMRSRGKSPVIIPRTGVEYLNGVSLLPQSR